MLEIEQQIISKRQYRLQHFRTGEASGLASPDDQDGGCQNHGEEEKEEAPGEIQKQQVPGAKAEAVDGGSTQGPVQA